MKALVIYDSQYGNTRQIAETVAGALGGPADAQAVRSTEVTPAQLQGLSVLVVGAPTQKFRPTADITRLLRSLAPGSLQGVRVAAFDTRLDVAATGSKMLSFLVRMQGAAAYAADHLAHELRRISGADQVPTEGFMVEGQEGPLRAGELERAARWAGQLGLSPLRPSGTPLQPPAR